MTPEKITNRLFKASDGVEIFYRISRCPDATHTLLMLHGLASNHSRWSEFVEHTQLADHMNLVWLDLRGHGKSNCRSYISHEVWQQDLYGILQQESLDKIIIVGHSLGAQLALHFALHHPAYVQSLILIDPTLPEYLKGKLAAAKKLRFLLKLTIAVLRVIKTFSRSADNYPDRDLHELDLATRKLMQSHSVEIIAEKYTTPSEDLKYMSLLNYLQDLYATTDRLPNLFSIQCPVKVLLSKGSTIVDAGKIKHYFSPNTILEITEIEANHWPLTERPKETRRAIEDWCLQQLNES